MTAVVPFLAVARETYANASSPAALATVVVRHFLSPHFRCASRTSDLLGWPTPDGLKTFQTALTFSRRSDTSDGLEPTKAGGLSSDPRSLTFPPRRRSPAN